MKRLVLLACALFCVMNFSLFGRADELRVMSYNVLTAHRDDLNAWADRRGNLVADIQATAPDLLGLQEACKNQLEYIMSSLDGYAFIGVARDDGREAGEFCPVIYKIAEFDVLDGGTFWLSETPTVPGRKGWGAACNRVVSWGLFRAKANDKVFVYANTHFDHVSEQARGESSKLILAFKEEISEKYRKEVGKDGLPFIITGDFNSVDTDAAYTTIISGLRDAQKEARVRRGGDRTFPAQNPPKKGKYVIDYIFLTDDFTVESFDIHSDPPAKGPLPSDHYAIDALLSW